MRKSVVQKRMAEMSPELIAQVRRMIREGYGAHGISLNSPATVKQANAVFAYERQLLNDTLEQASKQLGSSRVFVSADGSTIFIPLPRELWRDHPFGEKYDTLAIPAKPKAGDCTWMVHAPEYRDSRTDPTLPAGGPKS